jgi:hypothetical protein
VGSPADASAEAEVLTGVILDEMYPPALAQRLCANGHDVVAVLDVEVGLASKSDEDVSAWAARNSRCVVTENVSDFARLAGQGFAHCGLIFVSSRRFPRTATGLHRLGDALDALLSSKRLPGRDGIVWLQDPYVALRLRPDPRFGAGRHVPVSLVVSGERITAGTARRRGRRRT